MVRNAVWITLQSHTRHVNSALLPVAHPCYGALGVFACTPDKANIHREALAACSCNTLVLTAPPA